MAQNQVVVVTGGGRGIGRAICQRFAADGAQVMAAARNAVELEDTQREITQSGGRCHVHPTDVCVPDEIHALIEATAGRFGRIDVLVNCAGIAPQALIEELEPSLFNTIRCVNVDAVYFTCRRVWPVMKAQKSGVIVNISSIASIDAFPGFAAYGAAKAWVNAWTKALAEEGRGCGIRVFSVAPGAVETRMLRDAFPDFPDNQTLQPTDVANVVHCLAQQGCRYATGQTVFVRRQGD